MRKKKPGGLASKVLKLKPGTIKRDKVGRYLPFCNFTYHCGLILDEKTCTQRKCRNYYKLYISKTNRVF